MHNHKHSHEKAALNFKKARSVLDKMIAMAEGEAYCIDIMQQNLAAIGLLKSAHQMLLEKHLNTCFKDAFEKKSDERRREAIREVLQVAKLSNK